MAIKILHYEVSTSLRNLSLVKKIETAINITNKQNRTVNNIEGLLQNMSLQNCY